MRPPVGTLPVSALALVTRMVGVRATAAVEQSRLLLRLLEFRKQIGVRAPL